MAKFQVWVTAKIELDIEADTEEKAEEEAKEVWYEALQYGGDVEVEDIYCYEE